MATAAYGATNPAGTDPWPIESIIAKEALTGNPSAHAMLADYRMAREADTNLYNQSMVGQHEFAKQQLADAMSQARMKTIVDMTGKTGANAFLAGGGIEGIGPGAGGNPAAWAGYGQAGQQHDFATNLELTGRGIEGLSRAGQDLPIQQIPGLQNFQTTGAGQHSDITVEDKKAANALQIAAMHAKRGDGGSGDGTGFTMSGSVPNAYGGDDHFSAGKKVSQAKIDALREARGQRRIDPQTPAQDLPGGAGARSGTGTTAPTEAERKGVRTPPARSNIPQNAAAGVPGLQQRVIDNEANMQRQNPALYNDYVAGKARNNGKPDVRIENGRPVLYGGSGRPLN